MLPRTRPVVIGIDPSSEKLAFVIGHGLHVVLETCKFPAGPDNRTRALAQMYSQSIRVIGGWKNVQRITIERPTAPPKLIGSMIPQAMASGAVHAAAGRLEHTVDLVAIPDWKASVVGKGNASKEDVRKFVQNNYPEIYAKIEKHNPKKFDQDLCDAFCIYLYSWRIYRMCTRLKAQ